MELVQRVLPILALITSVGLILKEYIYDFMSIGVVKQVLETFTGLTPREAGDIVIIQAKHIMLIVKTSLALVLNTFFLVYDRIVSILPIKIGENTSNFMIGVLKFYGNILYTFVFSILNLFRVILHLIPQITEVFYRLGQGIYAILAIFNKGISTLLSIWNWLQEPPVSDRFLIITGILILSFILYFGVKFYRTCVKKLK